MVVLQLRESGGEAGAEEVDRSRQTGVLIGVVVVVVVAAAAVAAVAAVAVVLPSSEGELDLVPAAVPLMAKVCSILLQLHAFLCLYSDLVNKTDERKNFGRNLLPPT